MDGLTRVGAKNTLSLPYFKSFGAKVPEYNSKCKLVEFYSYSLNVNNLSATEEEKEKKKDSCRGSIKLGLRAGLWLVLLPVEGDGAGIIYKTTRAEGEECFLSHRPLAVFALLSPEDTPA